MAKNRQVGFFFKFYIFIDFITNNKILNFQKNRTIRKFKLICFLLHVSDAESGRQ